MSVLLAVIAAVLLLCVCVVRSADIDGHVEIDNVISDAIPSNFIAFSLEIDTARYWFGTGAPGAWKQSFVALMNQLRLSAVMDQQEFRIGGNSADYSLYNDGSMRLPNATSGFPYAYNITSSDIAAYRNSMLAINGALIIDVNMRNATDPVFALNHLRAVDQIIGLGSPMIKGIEIGNENGLYRLNGNRPTYYSFDDYMNEFQLYTDSIMQNFRKNISSTRRIFQGSAGALLNPGGGNGIAWNSSERFSDYVNRFSDRIYDLAEHYYPETVCHAVGQPAPNVTIAQLLQRADATSFPAQVAALQLPSFAAANRLYFIHGEGNSVSCYGAAGVSNVFASALWALDQMYSAAAANISRWSWHVHDQSMTGYAPITWNTTSDEVAFVHPLYYALRFFAEATRDRASIVRMMYSGRLNTDFLVMRSTVTATKRIDIAILYKDMNATTNAVVTILLTSWHLSPDVLVPPALVRILTAPNASATDNVTFAGETYYIWSNGRPIKVANNSYTITPDPTSRRYTVSVPPMSALLITMQIPTSLSSSSTAGPGNATGNGTSSSSSTGTSSNVHQ